MLVNIFLCPSSFFPYVAECFLVLSLFPVTTFDFRRTMPREKKRKIKSFKTHSQLKFITLCSLRESHKKEDIESASQSRHLKKWIVCCRIHFHPNSRHPSPFFSHVLFIIIYTRFFWKELCFSFSFMDLITLPSRKDPFVNSVVCYAW